MDEMQKNKTPLDEPFTLKEVKMGSNRSFGLVFAAVFVLLAFGPLIKNHPIRWWALLPALIFLCTAFLAPRFLAPLNRIWFWFGLMLHKIVSPIVLGLMFFMIFTPFALLMRLFGKRPLHLHLDRNASSYWILRNPPGPLPKSMSQQF